MAIFSGFLPTQLSNILVPRLEVDHQRIKEKIPRGRRGQSSQCGFLYASNRCIGKQQTELLDPWIHLGI